jgi:hypothetical protein
VAYILIGDIDGNAMNTQMWITEGKSGIEVCLYKVLGNGKDHLRRNFRGKNGEGLSIWLKEAVKHSWYKEEEVYWEWREKTVETDARCELGGWIVPRHRNYMLNQQ